MCTRFTASIKHFFSSRRCDFVDFLFGFCGRPQGKNCAKFFITKRKRGGESENQQRLDEREREQELN